MNLLQQLSAGIGKSAKKLNVAPVQQNQYQQMDDNSFTPDLQSNAYRPIQGTRSLPLQYQGATANIYGVQPQQYYNQQQPNQIGVSQHNLQTLANWDDLQFEAKMRSITPQNASHYLGYDNPAAYSALGDTNFSYPAQTYMGPKRTRETIDVKKNK